MGITLKSITYDESINSCADEHQKALSKRMPKNSPLSDAGYTHHILLWSTFFRRNLHRLATDYLQISLHFYEIVLLYLMGINTRIVIVAGRATAKSWLVALWACCMAIVYPGMLIVLSAPIKNQANKLISDKIIGSLCKLSPVLAAEIDSWQVNDKESFVMFGNSSKISVVVSNDNARGGRSNAMVREEFRMIPKKTDDEVLSPFQIIREAPWKTSVEYKDNKAIQDEEPINVYITSSWMDNGHWMWNLFDETFNKMLKNETMVAIGLDEAVTLKYKIKTRKQLEDERAKQDKLSWRIEFLNSRVKENTQAFFTYGQFSKNQNLEHPFYPRDLYGQNVPIASKWNSPKQEGEVRIICCDFAFVAGSSADRSVYTFMRAFPDYVQFDSNNVKISTGYRRQVPYMESNKGGDVVEQALRVRQLYEDFDADYIIIDRANAGCSIYDLLARTMYDKYREIEYSPLTCMNDPAFADARVKSVGARKNIYVINASQALNTEIATDFRNVLSNGQIELLVNFNTAQNDILLNIPEYTNSPSADEMVQYEVPFLETQKLVEESVSLISERKQYTNIVVIHEQGNNTKDRYTSVSYGSYFISQLEKDMLSNGTGEYGYSVFVN